MKNVKDLVIVENVNPLEVFTQEAIVPLLNKITKEVNSFALDVNTSNGRKDITSLAYKVSQSKTYLDGLGKELVSEWKAKAENVDSIRRKVRYHMDDLRDSIKAPLDVWEAVEERRVVGLKKRLEEFSSLNTRAELNSKEISEKIANISNVEIDQSWEEFQQQAMELKEVMINDLSLRLDLSIQFEAQQEEIKKLQAEKLEIEEKQRAMEFAAQENVKREEEAKRKSEHERLELIRKNEEAERRAADAERRAKEAEESAKRSEQAAKERAQREAKEREEAEKLAARQRAEREALEKANIKEAKRVEQEKIKRENADAEAKKSRHAQTVLTLAKELQTRSKTQSFEEIAEWIVSEWKEKV